MFQKEENNPEQMVQNKTKEEKKKFLLMTPTPRNELTKWILDSSNSGEKEKLYIHEQFFQIIQLNILLDKGSKKQKTKLI